jgi:hypothetical protein
MGKKQGKNKTEIHEMRNEINKGYDIEVEDREAKHMNVN